MDNIGISDLLQHSFVISINDFRHKVFCERFAKYGLDCPMPKLYRGFQLKNGVCKDSGFIKTRNVCNCYFTHIALVKFAQSLDWPYIAIFEDDALPCKKIVEKLLYYLKVLPEDADILKLGHLKYMNQPVELTSDFVKVHTYGSHAYVIFNKYYQDYICIASNNDIRVDCTCMNTNNKNIYTPKECLFIQADDLFQDTVLHNHLKEKTVIDLNDIKNDFEIGNFNI